MGVRTAEEGSVRRARVRALRLSRKVVPSDHGPPAVSTPQRHVTEELALRHLGQVSQAAIAALPRVIEDALAELGSSLALDRTTVFEITPDRRSFRMLRGWVAPDVQRLPIMDVEQACPELVARVLRGELIWHDDIEELRTTAPRDFSTLEGLGQQSLLVLPLQIGGTTVGAHALGGTLRPKRWTEDVIAGLRSFGQVLGSALLRIQNAKHHARRDEERRETERLARLGHWAHNYAHGSTVGSEQLFQIFHLDPRSELDLLETAAMIHPDDRARYEGFLAALLVGASAEPIEVRVVHRDGELSHLSCRGEACRDVDGRLTFARGVIHDVTERKRDEMAMMALNHRLIRAHEEERTRLAREIHDDLGQRLAALKLELDLIRRTPEVAAAAPRLTALSRAAGEVASVVRTLSHTLHPGVLERMGLSDALAALCRQTTKLSEIEVDHVQDHALPDLDPEVALSLYRVAQEALANATRHSGARHIEVTLRIVDGVLCLAVHDDGVGISAHPTAEPGLGLLGMRERMRLIGGTLHVRSGSVVGTRIEARVSAPTEHGA